MSSLLYPPYLLAQILKHLLILGAQAARVSPVLWALLGTVVALSGCAPDNLGLLSDVAQLMVSNAPGVFAAVGIAIRAQKRIRISDDERERIAVEAQATAVRSMAETINTLRTDLNQAQTLVQEALGRERTAMDRVRHLMSQQAATQADLTELRRILRAGGITVTG